MHCGGYKFDEALALSHDVRRLLLSVAAVEQERRMVALEKSLGVLWEVADLVEMMGATVARPDRQGDQKGAPRSRVKLPLLLGLAPELIMAQARNVSSTYASADARFVAPGTKVHEIAAMDPKEVKALYDMMNRMEGVG